MHHPTERIAHTTAFVTPVVEHWLEREIAQWVHPMKDRSDDPSHHERTLLPRSYISLPFIEQLQTRLIPGLKKKIIIIYIYIYVSAYSIGIWINLAKFSKHAIIVIYYILMTSAMSRSEFTKST